MSTEVTWQTKSTSSNETEQLAERLSKALKGGEVIELVSDLAGGKTTFVRGLVRGLGSKDTVASPTFTISRIYKTKAHTVHHFDFYRLTQPGLVAHELAEATEDPNAIVIIEWAQIVQNVLPSKRLTITIEQTPSGARQLTFRCHESLQYLLNVLT